VTQSVSPSSAGRSVNTLDADTAAHFARLALAHVAREYPNKLDHILLDDEDVQSPASLHPVFFGSFDWHSCVHGYWLMATVARKFPRLDESARIAACFDTYFTEARMAVEVDYARHAARGAFERPYGWAWLLMLAAELERHDTEAGQRWAATLAPLTACFVDRFLAFLPKATYPVRVGTHYNTAFALRLALEYADASSLPAARELGLLVRATARRWYAGDHDCQAWEPSGDDFLSSALIEAECMRWVLSPEAFHDWFAEFLPRLSQGEPSTLLQPAEVSDRSDDKIAHLDGLNLSRGWCWRALAGTMAVGDMRRAQAMQAVDRHLAASLPWVAGDYMGEHWLATFALLALDPARDGARSDGVQH